MHEAWAIYLMAAIVFVGIVAAVLKVLLCGKKKGDPAPAPVVIIQAANPVWARADS